MSQLAISWTPSVSGKIIGQKYWHPQSKIFYPNLLDHTFIVRDGIGKQVNRINKKNKESRISKIIKVNKVYKINKINKINKIIKIIKKKKKEKDNQR